MAMQPDIGRRRWLALGALGGVGAWLPTRAFSAGQLFVIMSAQSTVQAVSQKELLALFTGRTLTLPNGEPAQPLDQQRDGIARAAFYQTLAGMDLARINSYWARLHFSAKVQPPQVEEDDAAVLRRVRQDPTAIGYLTREPGDAGVRVVLRLS